LKRERDIGAFSPAPPGRRIGGTQDPSTRPQESGRRAVFVCLLSGHLSIEEEIDEVQCGSEEAL
jgi:hypothetical protein